MKSLEKTIGVSKAGEHPLDRRNVLLIGSDNMVTALAYGIQARKGVLSVASPNDDDETYSISRLLTAL